MTAATLKLRSDLVFSHQGGPQGITLIVKDPVRGRLFRFREAEDFILGQLKAAVSFEAVRQRVDERFQGALPAEALQKFIDRLRQVELLEGESAPNAKERPRRLLGDVLYLRFKAFDPDRLLDAMVDRLRFFFTPAFVVVSALLLLLAFGVIVGQWQEIGRQFYTLLRFESLLLAWVVMLTVVTLHEFAHGLTCKRFGGHVREMGAMLIYFQPAFYCNVSDAWLFPEKSKRLWVTFAGAYFEMFVWAVATLVWRVTEPGLFLNQLALIVAATSAFKWQFNMNPLIKLDGYYLLIDWLDIPNLRLRAFAYLRGCVGRLTGAGGAAMPPVTPRERRIYLTYALLSGAYSFSLLGFILWHLGDFLVARYQAWGFAAYAAVLGVFFRGRLRNAAHRLGALCRNCRSGLGFLLRHSRLPLLLALLLATLHLLETDLRVPGSFTVLPVHNADVRAEVGGIIEQINVREGDVVEAGAPIARLSDRDYSAELRQVKAEIEEKQARLRLLKAGPRPEEVELARTAIVKAREHLKYAQSRLEMDRQLIDEHLISKREYDVTAETVMLREKELQEANERLAVLLAGSRIEEIEAAAAEINRLQTQRQYLEDQLRALTVNSPIAGIVTTHKVEEKLGQLVNKGDLIADVHALKRVEVEIAVSEKEIADVRVGQRVTLKARAYSDRQFEGSVTAIAPVAREPGEGAFERTVLVTTQLDNPALLLKPAMSGEAKVACGRRTLLELLTRRFVRFIRVEFWSWW